MLRKILVMSFLLTCAASAGGQTPSPTPLTMEQRMELMQQELEFLKKQKELEDAKSDLSNRRLDEIMKALPKSSIKTLDGETEFKSDKDANAESISLSYDALKELSAQINEAMKANTSRYSGVVIYNEPDFLALAKYRLYSSQSKIALKNYDLLVEKLKELTEKSGSNGTRGLSTKSIDPVTMALSLPTMGTAVAKSVAELISVFRSDTVITQSKDTINEDALGTVFANELRKIDPNIRIFYPHAFVAEYDLETDGDDTIFSRIVRVNAAITYLTELLAQIEELPQAERNDPELKQLISTAKMIKSQLEALMFAGASSKDTRGSGDKDKSDKDMSEFRQLIRAEKLDRFLRGMESSASNGNMKLTVKEQQDNMAKIGILKLRVLASGGSRKETRNLFLGNKVSYSGSAIIEVLLFDANGTLRASEIFSYHTGFRKMKTDGKKL